MDAEAREGFSNSVARKIESDVGINMHGERIKSIDKNNIHAAFPYCNEIETLEYVTLFNKQNEQKVKWLQKLKSKFDALLKKIKTTEYETNVVQQIENDVKNV